MFSFGVLISKMKKQTPIWREEGSTFWQEKDFFFKSNMDALTVLFIRNTGMRGAARAELAVGQQVKLWVNGQETTYACTRWRLDQ